MKIFDNPKTFLRNLFRAFKMSLRYAKWPTVLMAAMVIITSLIPVAQSRILGNIVNLISESVKTSPSATAAFVLVLMYAGIWAINLIANEINLYVDKIWTLDFEQGLDLEILRRRAGIDLAHYESPEFQNLLDRAFKRGIWPVFRLIEMQFQNFGNLASILVTSVVVININWQIYVVVLLAAIPTFVVKLKYGHKIWDIWGENSPRQRMYSHLREQVHGRVRVTQVKMLQATSKLINIATGILQAFKKDQKQVDKTRLFYAIGASVIGAGGIGFGLYIIVNSVVAGAITAGTLVFLVSILNQLVSAVNSFLKITAQQYEENLYANDIFKVMDTKPYIIQKKNALKLKLSAAPKIEFKNVSFKYEDRKDWILRDVNFTIESGEQIGLVGENGAGKSTMVKLLMRIYDPTQGSILIDGHDLRDIDTEQWISYVSVLLQKYSTYEFKIAESIAMGRSLIQMSKQRAVAASKLSGAHDFISGYEEGYDQQLGKEFQGGIEPSQGQEQKIALARTLYRLEDGFTLILDEPTAAIDPVAEAAIFERMEGATKGKNLILITHRFNTVKGVDKIVVIEHGRVVEIGNHVELMQKNGHYAKMFKSQAKGFVDGMVLEKPRKKARVTKPKEAKVTKLSISTS